MGYITAAFLAGTAIYSAIDASNRRKKAKAGIERLKKLQPKYRNAGDIQAEAEATIQEGYSPSEKAAFVQQMTRSGRAAYQKAVQSNPNLSTQVQSAINYANTGAISRFAASDADLRRRRVSEFVSRTTGQSNAQTSADLQNKRDQEMAFGLAKQQTNADIQNAIFQLGYAGASAGSQYQANRTSTIPDTSTTMVGGANPNSPMVAGDGWARNLYGNPTGYNPSQQPIMSNYGYNYPLRSTPIMANTQVGTGSVPPSRRWDQWGWMNNPNQYNPY